MSFTFVPGERIVREEDGVWYYGGSKSASGVMVGQLVMTDKKLLFYEKRPKGRGLETCGLAISLPLDGLLGARIEERRRSKWSRPAWRNPKTYQAIIEGNKKVNEPPGILDAKDSYYVLMMTLSIPSGVENLIFEVLDPVGWMETIKRLGPREGV